MHAVGLVLAAGLTLPNAARDPAPEDLIGQPLARIAARDDAERTLRRLGAEIEIWLAGHELNREREARNLPPLNALWFWGGARVVPLPHRRKCAARRGGRW